VSFDDDDDDDREGGGVVPVEGMTCSCPSCCIELTYYPGEQLVCPDCGRGVEPIGTCEHGELLTHTCDDCDAEDP
jgi:hypothetical protein